MSVDTNNAEFQDALNLIQYTRQSVFLTGKAGTGKSTFLRYVCEHTKKKHVVLAPTGIAAINAGGSTMHSFFKQEHLLLNCNAAEMNVRYFHIVDLSTLWPVFPSSLLLHTHCGLNLPAPSADHFPPVVRE